MTLDKMTINRIVDFCYKYGIPNVPGAMSMYEGFHNELHDNYKTWITWKNVYKAYWDKDLRRNLGYESK